MTSPHISPPVLNSQANPPPGRGLKALLVENYDVPMQRWVSESLVVWAIIGSIVLADIVWARALGIAVVLNPPVVLALALVVSINLVYTTIRPDPRIAAFAQATSQLIAFTSSATLLSYLSVTSNF